MEKPRDPIMEEIESLKKIKTLFLTTTIVGIIFVFILKEIALMFIMISIPLAILAFIIALFAIIIVNSDPLEKVDESTIENINIDEYRGKNVRVVNKSGAENLKVLGTLFLSYIIIGGFAYIMMLLNSLFTFF